MSLAHREYDSDETRALFELVADLAQREIRPVAAAAEQAGAFPDRPFALLSEAGLMGLPYPGELGGGGLPDAVDLQVGEERAGGRPARRGCPLPSRSRRWACGPRPPRR